MGMFKEFKDFAIKGNVLDLAVAVVIGAAFGKIVTSFVKDVIMPPIGMAMGNVDFNDLKYIMQQGQAAVMDGATEITPAVAEVAINYGTFIMTIVDFIIIAFAIFMVVRAFNNAKKKEEAAPAPAPPEPSNEEKLLTEIRDLLKK